MENLPHFIRRISALLYRGGKVKILRKYSDLTAATRTAKAKTRKVPAAARAEHAEIRAEQAEARTESAEARAEHAETRTEQAKTRTESAEARAESAETRTEQAKTRTELAETRAERAEARTEQAETSLKLATQTKVDSAPASSHAPVTSVPVDGMADQRTLLAQLTPRQREILQLIAEGETTKQIGDMLKLSPKTVEYHRLKLMNCLNVHDVPGSCALHCGWD
jgi:DNA-binding NarL/FixJ family response regulator